MIKKAKDLVDYIKSRFGSGGDVFFKAGVMIAQSQRPYAGTEMRVVHNSSLDNYSPNRPSIEEMFNVRVQKIAGGGGNYKKYGEIKPKDYSVAK